MSGHSGGLLGCLYRSLLAAIRVLLMIFSFIMLLSAIVKLWASYRSDDEFLVPHIPDHELPLAEQLLAIVMVVLALVGLHGAYTLNPTYLKAFVLIAASMAACGFLFNSNPTKEWWALERERVAETMEEYAYKYQWNLSPGLKRSVETNVWDSLQRRLTCCGWLDPRDWTNKWKNFRRDTLPQSCCLIIPRLFERDQAEPRKCTLEGAYTVGCMERLDNLIGSWLSSKLANAVMYLILACWAFLLAKFGLPTSRPSGSSAVPDASHCEKLSGLV